MTTFTDISKVPAKNKNALSDPEHLISRLQDLIGTTFNLTGKPRTDGSNLRKLITETLLSQHIPEESPNGTYSIIPPKAKGVPKFLREYIDTYIVTSGETYNLQVWNRNPNSDFIQVDYTNDTPLLASDVRFIFGKINTSTQILESIVILSPDYIVTKFGKFGKPTIKQQLIISNIARWKILNSTTKIIFEPDDNSIQNFLNTNTDHIPSSSIKDMPTTLLPLTYINEHVVKNLTGVKLDSRLSTKQRGQELEKIIATKLGYTLNDDSLIGGYPDIRNQMLEVKVQDSQTIDLGRYSPQFKETILNDFNTENMRYLIALTNPDTEMIEGVILCPGSSLGKYFSYVSDTSFKCQRGIPMDFFDSFNGNVVYNP